MEENKNTDIIDLRLIAKKIWGKRKFFLYKVWPITFAVSCFIILCVPRYYISEAKLAPELGNTIANGSLGSLATSVGLNLGNMGNGDAISPLLYPDLMEDNGFVASLFNVRVKSADGEIDTNYYTYLKKYQKSAWWSAIINWIKKSIKFSSPKDVKHISGEGKKSPYWLTEEDYDRAEAVRNNIKFTVDKLTAVITITVKAQDALIAKTMTDSAQVHLQQFITNYRTNKARIDEKHYKQLVAEAEQTYKKACADYATYADTHSKMTLQAYMTKENSLQREMDIKYETLQQLSLQLQVASAKVQERTPAFTVIKGAAVAPKPAGPKRMMFVLGMLILVSFIGMFWVVRNELHF